MTEPRRPAIRPNAMADRILGLALAFVLAACSGATASPTPQPTPRPTPTPVGSPVSNPQEAAALVLATNPLFSDARQLDPDLIGQSRWWAASPLADGGYTIEVTVGWGDCPSGCINRHVWTFEVTADGTITLAGETGDEVPQPLPE